MFRDFLWSVARSAFLLGCVPALSGCGSSRGTIPLEGRVTFAGGPPSAPGRVIFIPIPPTKKNEALGAVGRFALGVFDAAGHYRTSTFSEGDGILPGQYEVVVECGDAKPLHDDPHRFHGQSAAPTGSRVQPLDVRPDAERPIRHDIDVR